MHGGAVHHCCEYPEEVVKIRDKALSQGSLMTLESPSIPAGQKFYLDPTQVESIGGVR
jgi:hypothetical protein